MKLFTYAQPRSTCRLYQTVTRHRSETASNSSNQYLDERIGKTIYCSLPFRHGQDSLRSISPVSHFLVRTHPGADADLSSAI